MQLFPSEVEVDCQVLEPESSIPFQGIYKKEYENIFILNKESISKIL